MYINSVAVSSDICIVLCLVPMLTIALFECRIFAYFLLIRERLMVVNETIIFLKNDLNSAKDDDAKEKSSIFFIASELSSFKINGKFNNEKPELIVVSSKRLNFIEKFKSMMQREWQLMKLIFSSDDERMYVRDLEATKHHRITHANYHMRQLHNIQIIYSKLNEIPNHISSAFGIQIIAIISVQFITLTTLMYTFSMKITRFDNFTYLFIPF